VRINVARFEQLASLVFQIKGPGSLTELEDAIFATFPIDASAPVEFLFPQRIYRFGAVFHTSAVGGQFPWNALVNPVGSNTIAVLEGWGISETAGTELLYISRGIVPGFTEVGTGEPLDGRLSPQTESACRTYRDNTATSGLGQQIREESRIAGGDLHRADQIVLVPDTTVLIRGDTAGSALTTTFQWRERQASKREI